MFTYNELNDICPEVYEVPVAANVLSLLQAVEHHARKGLAQLLLLISFT